MNDFVTHLKDLFIWPSLEEIFPGGYQKNMPYRLYDDDKILDQQFITKLASVDLSVNAIEIMWKPKGHRIISKYGVIHVDNFNFESQTKIVYVLGGTNSTLVWYDLNKNVEINPHKWKIADKPVKRINSLDSVTEIHRQPVKFSLVEIGTHMHAIDNPYEDRTAIGCKIIESSTKKILPYQEVKKRIKTLDMCL